VPLDRSTRIVTLVSVKPESSFISPFSDTPPHSTHEIALAIKKAAASASPRLD
jgi:hypothetical protein